MPVCVDDLNGNLEHPVMNRLLNWIEANDDRFFAFTVLLYLLSLPFGG